MGEGRSEGWVSKEVGGGDSDVIRGHTKVAGTNISCSANDCGIMGKRKIKVLVFCVSLFFVNAR